MPKRINRSLSVLPSTILDRGGPRKLASPRNQGISRVILWRPSRWEHCHMLKMPFLDRSRGSPTSHSDKRYGCNLDVLFKFDRHTKPSSVGCWQMAAVLSKCQMILRILAVCSGRYWRLSISRLRAAPENQDVEGNHVLLSNVPLAMRVDPSPAHKASAAGHVQQESVGEAND